jgi:cell division protein FtsL
MQGKTRLTPLVQEYYTRKAKYSLQKEANLLKPKYMKQEEATQNIKNQLKSRTEKEKIEEIKNEQSMDNSTRTLKAHQ